jgi:hypothetical protein
MSARHMPYYNKVRDAFQKKEHCAPFNFVSHQHEGNHYITAGREPYSP